LVENDFLTYEENIENSNASKKVDIEIFHDIHKNNENNSISLYNNIFIDQNQHEDVENEYDNLHHYNHNSNKNGMSNHSHTKILKRIFASNSFMTASNTSDKKPSALRDSTNQMKNSQSSALSFKGIKRVLNVKYFSYYEIMLLFQIKIKFFIHFILA
jgi:hypothetical protein